MEYSSKRILVCIEDLESSTRLLDYVADLASGNEDFAIYPFHAVGRFRWSCVSSAELRTQKPKTN